ncbi:MAG: prenyltransferase [Chloroflexi bacterium]|nr:prenyltransferase [Chloroflexota bacterium]
MKNLLRLARPMTLLLAALTYFLGASIADYLGKTLQPDFFWLGLLGVLLSQTSMNLLAEVFRLDVEPLQENETRRERQSLRNNALYVSIGSLAAVALIAYLLNQISSLSPQTFLLLLLSLLFILAYSIPPFRFVNRGFGEFILAAHIAYVIPSLAFVLQADETHRFLMLTIPLTFLGLAYFIAMDFPSFASDQKYGRVTFLTRLGWERVVPLHNIFLIFAYIFLSLSPTFGLLFSLIWPAFLTLPFALFQLYQLRNISLGARVNWTLLAATALAVFGLTAYFITMAFWLR